MPRQFDIAENLDATGRGQYPFLLVLQHDQISSVSSVIVAPQFEASLALTRTKLHPTIDAEGRSYVVLIEQMAGAPRSTLGRVVGSAENCRYQIVAALDLLFTGI